MKTYGFFVPNPIHVHHVVSIIVELARLQSGPIHVLSKRDGVLDRLRSQLAAHGVEGRVVFTRIGSEFGNRLPTLLQDRLKYRVGEKTGLYAEKSGVATRAMYDFLLKTLKGFSRPFVDAFAQIDVLVCPDKDLVWLQKFAPNLRCRTVYTGHGAGDAYYGFDQRYALHDLVFVSGSCIKDRFLTMPGFRDAQIRVVGYPKFDVCGRHPETQDLFGNGRRTVLYVPHNKPKLTSWRLWGAQVLDFFMNQSRYNLIFAPHLNLYADKNTTVPERYDRVPHMRIDRGSEAMLDMSYMGAADIYLGDVSAQVYEFIQRPKPCVFLNAHGVDWRDDPNYRHWRLGPVIDHPGQLAEVLDTVETWQGSFTGLQADAVAERFLLHDQPAGRLAAQNLIAIGDSDRDDAL